MLKLTRLPRIAATCLMLAGAGLAAPAIAQESTDPIKLTLHDWTGQLITTQLMGEVLKKAGYSVEYVQADYLAQFAGLESGDLHVAMEIWETTAARRWMPRPPPARSRISARPVCWPRKNGGFRST